MEFTHLPPPSDPHAERAKQPNVPLSASERRWLLADADRLRQEAAESEDPAMRETLIACAELREHKASPPALRLVRSA